MYFYPTLFTLVGGKHLLLIDVNIHFAFLPKECSVQHLVVGRLSINMRRVLERGLTLKPLVAELKSQFSCL